MSKARNLYDHRQVQKLLVAILCGEPHEPLTSLEMSILFEQAREKNVLAKMVLNAFYGVTNGKRIEGKMYDYESNMKAVRSHLSHVRLYRLPFTHIYFTKDKHRIERAMEISRHKP